MRHSIRRVLVAGVTAVTVAAVGALVQVSLPAQTVLAPALASAAVAPAALMAPTAARLGQRSTPVAKAGKPERVREVGRLRTQTSKSYEMSDGKVQLVLSAEPVHYRSNGAWSDIDTTVMPGVGDVAFANDKNAFRVEFGKSTDDLMKFEADGASIALGAIGESRQSSPTVKGSTVTYADVFGPADLRYKVTPTSLKEEVVLDSAPSAADDVSYSFDLKTGGLKVRELPGGSIGFFKNGRADTVPDFVMPAPYMFDATSDGVIGGSGWSDKVTQTLVRKGATTTVTLTADRSWLSEVARKFPVVIDPTITVVPDPSAAQDATISEYVPTTTYPTGGTIPVGSNAAQQTWRGLFKFDTSMIPAGTTIRSADLNLHFSTIFASEANVVPISAHQVTKDWTESTATWAGLSTSFNPALEYNRVQVDDTDSSSTSFEGPWKDAPIAGSIGGTLSYTGAFTTPDTFTWNARVPGPGDYKVEAYYTPHATRGTPTYTITGDVAPATAAAVNQTVGPITGSWAQLVAAKHFAPEMTAQVTTVRQTGTVGTSPVADAVRWTEFSTQSKEKEQHDAWHSFAVGSLVQKWVTAPASNFGLMLKASNDTTGPVGGPYYQASEDAFGGETQNRPALVVTYDEPGVTLNPPNVIHADGPELTWSKYQDPTPAEGDNLVEYQIFRGCRTLPASTCTNPGGEYYTTNSPAGLQLVGTVASDSTSWTDETAVASTATEPATYNYWVVARTVEDTRNGQDGRAASNVQAVTTPREGRIVRVLNADMPDTTLSAAQPTTVLPRPEGLSNRYWLQTGNAHTTYGDERSVFEFDTAPITQAAKVTDARLELFETNATPGTAIMDLHALTRDFVENQATWNQATSTIPWTTSGGDYDPSLLGSLTTDTQPQRLTFASAGLTGKVQSWVNNLGDNHGFLLKARDETVSQQWVNIVNSESPDNLFRPRLYIEHLVKNDAKTIEADQLPERFVPGTTVKAPVTVTNTTATTWPAGLQLSYRWTEPGQSTDITVSGERNYVPLARALEPGASVTLDLPIRTPINADTGAKRLAYDIYLDLWTGSAWFSATNPLSTNTTRPSQGCAMMSTGLLCVDRYVEDPTSSQLGLEKSYSYTGEDTGGGGQLLTNLYSGNLVWSYDAMSNPSIGPSTFVRLAYNSMDVTDSGAGFGVSVQTSTLTRLGSRLSVPQGGSTNKLMTFIDGDGTTHTYKLDETLPPSTTLTYTRPAGVALELTRDLTADVAHQWVFARPDGTRFYFNQGTGLQTSAVDRNGNTLSYNYDTSGRLTSLRDSSGRTTLTLGWNATGLDWIRDLSGRALKLSFNPTHQLTKVEDGGQFDTTTKTFGTATAVKAFPIGYTEESVNANAKLSSIGDPRGATTSIQYFTSTENSAFALWPKQYTDRRGNDTTFTYTDPDSSAAKDLIAQVTDVNGATPSVTTYRMDGFGRATSIKDANANATGSTDVTTLGWDRDHNVIRLEEPGGAVSTWEYDPRTGYPLKVKDALAVKNNTPAMAMDYTRLVTAPGQPTVLNSKTSAQGRKDTFTYDPANGNLKTVRNNLGFGPTYVYNTNGTLATVTDARNGVVTYAGYDVNGYPQTITEPMGASFKTDFVYDVRGNVMQVKDALAQITTAQYDAFGRPTAITTPDDGVVTRTTATTYDVNDNVVKETAPNGAETSQTYDAADNVTTKSLPDNNKLGRKIVSTYDPLGRLLQETAPNGVETALANDFVTKYGYDRVGQVVNVDVPFVDAVGAAKNAVTTYTYDSAGNKIGEVDPNKNASAADDYTTKMVYDLNHRVTAITDAAGYTSKNEYDRDGLLVAEIDAVGNKKRTVYDAAGQPTEVHVPHTPTGGAAEDRVTISKYDGVGNVTRVTRPSGKFDETVFDANNRAVQKKSAFDAADLVYKTASSTFMQYDVLGQMSRQSEPTFTAAGTAWTDLTYFASGDVKSSTDPWLIATSYDYNLIGQQTSRTLSNPTESSTRSMAWGFFPDGSASSRTDTAAQQPVDMVDNVDAWQTTSVGTWATATTATNRYGADYRTHAAAAAGTTAASDSFSWKVTPDVGGPFDVFVSCPVRTDTATNATYTINHATGAATAVVNQKACTAAAQWVKLGSYTFAGGATKTVVLKPSTVGLVVADGLKLVSTGGVAARSFTYEYDANGAQTQVRDGDAAAVVDTFTTAYDGLGRAAKVVELKGGVAKRSTDYTYDLNSNTTSTNATRPADGGNLAASSYTANTWDVRNLVDTVRSGASAGGSLDTFAFTYDPRGSRSTLVKPNGNVTTSGYHEDGLVRSMVEKTSAGNGSKLVASHSLKYNADGDRREDVEKLDEAGTTGVLDQSSTYAYTPAQKLKSVTKTGADKGENESYVYDAGGNITSQSIGAVSTAMTYDRNRLTKTVSGATTMNHRYDAFGRSSTIDVGAQVVERYSYDGYDRMVKQQKWNTAGVHQATRTTGFDPFDRTKTASVQVTTAAAVSSRFAYLGLADQVAVQEQANTAGTYEVAKVFSYGPGGEKLSLVDTPVNAATTKKFFYGTNPHGDVESLTDATSTGVTAGQATSTYRYTAYGSADKKGTTGEDAITGDPVKDADLVNPYRFGGKRFEGATGSYDMGFRDYNPGLNRFLSRDMYNGALDDVALGADPWNTNRYAFAGGNPISRVELDGHMAYDGEGGGGGDPADVPAPEAPGKSFLGSIGDAVSNAYSATSDFVVEHKATIAGIGTGLLVTSGCTIASFGVGTVGCIALGGASGSAVSNALDENADHSMAGYAKTITVGTAISVATLGAGKAIGPLLSRSGSAAAKGAAELPEGYSSFRAAKRAMGSPGEGNVFDHVVEQSQIGRSSFAREEIHNPFNMNPVSAETNQLKANYYSTKQLFTGGGTVRDWLSGQSFSDQYEFGMDAVAKIQNGVSLP